MNQRPVVPEGPDVPDRDVTVSLTLPASLLEAVQTRAARAGLPAPATEAILVAVRSYVFAGRRRAARDEQRLVGLDVLPGGVGG